MDYSQNHMFCFSNNWDNKEYWCTNCVSLSKYHVLDKEDFDNITCKKIFTSELLYKEFKDMYKDTLTEDQLLSMATVEIIDLKDNVKQWLNNNVKPHKTKHAWCYGSDEYRTLYKQGINIFFNRKCDALAFIKAWSVYKKPVKYYNSFKSEIKILNLKTLRYDKGVDLRYDCIGASKLGEDRNPPSVMNTLGIMYKESIPQSISDCWQFFGCVNLPDELPSYLIKYKDGEK